jgi:hypothetical protein
MFGGTLNEHHSNYRNYLGAMQAQTKAARPYIHYVASAREDENRPICTASAQSES